jgi:hypothetical protein
MSNETMLTRRGLFMKDWNAVQRTRGNRSGSADREISSVLGHAGTRERISSWIPLAPVSDFPEEKLDWLLSETHT